ncbi:MAG TPA: GNAT family N-acetyltransferase [Synergistaceae bacterium]|nr:GNAT family N-acetyltransferase [Synergistaceae bacterium]HPQ37276.1 GNAT family N-acetyltransferase [Synergistaceae bacterium]
MLIPEIDFCTPKHLEALDFLEKECFPEAPWPFRVLQRDLEEVFRETLFYLGAFWKGFLVGYAVFRPRGREWTLLRIGVQEAYRRHAIGFQLLEAGEILAREAGARKMFLEVREENRGARRLYENAGYVLQGTPGKMRRDTGKPALVYRKNFSDVSKDLTKELPDYLFEHSGSRKSP